MYLKQLFYSLLSNKLFKTYPYRAKTLILQIHMGVLCMEKAKNIYLDMSNDHTIIHLRSAFQLGILYGFIFLDFLTGFFFKSI